MMSFFWYIKEHSTLFLLLSIAYICFGIILSTTYSWTLKNEALYVFPLNFISWPVACSIWKIRRKPILIWRASILIVAASTVIPLLAVFWDNKTGQFGEDRFARLPPPDPRISPLRPISMTRRTAWCRVPTRPVRSAHTPSTVLACGSARSGSLRTTATATRTSIARRPAWKRALKSRKWSRRIMSLTIPDWTSTSGC